LFILSVSEDGSGVSGDMLMSVTMYDHVLSRSQISVLC